MTKEELSLLLYFESREVDQRGTVNSFQMNADERAIAEAWNEQGFVRYGRIPADQLVGAQGSSYWCRLSEEAWEIAGIERRARADRNRRSYE